MIGLPIGFLHFYRREELRRLIRRKPGPKTPEGVDCIRRSRWKHGKRSAAAIAERKERAAAGRLIWSELRAIERHLKVVLRVKLT